MILERVLIVGSGSIGRRHADVFRTILPHADVLVVSARRAKRLVTEKGKKFRGIFEALEFSPQIAVLANPAPDHLTLAMGLISEGVHTLVEKPLSIDTNGILELIELARQKKVTAAVGYNLRFLGSLQKFRSIIQGRSLGNIYTVRCEAGQYLPTWRPEQNYWDTVSARKKLGGGALLELSHEIDYLSWVFGKISTVNAKLSKLSDLQIDVEDSVQLSLEFQNESVIEATVSLDLFRHDTRRQCLAVGQKGSVLWDGVADVVKVYTSETPVWTEVYRDDVRQVSSYELEIKNFLESVSLHKDPLVTLEDGLRVMEVVDAVRESASEGKVVSVKKPELNEGY